MAQGTSPLTQAGSDKGNSQEVPSELRAVTWEFRMVEEIDGHIMLDSNNYQSNNYVIIIKVTITLTLLIDT